MPYTMEDYRKDYVREHMHKLPLAERIRGVAPDELFREFSSEERLRGLPPEERLEGLTFEQRLAGLTPEERLRAFAAALEKFREKFSEEEFQELTEIITKLSAIEKKLNYYLGLSYKIEVIPIRSEDGGGYKANFPEVGRLAIVGSGDTPAEAIADLERIKAEQFRHYLEKGIDIPEPGEKSEENFDEQFVISFPEALHKKIVLKSRENGISPDEFVVGSLSAVLG